MLIRQLVNSTTRQLHNTTIMNRLLILIAGILALCVMTMSYSCEEGEWLEYDEAKKGEYLASRYIADSTRMHLSPVASIVEYLKGGEVIAEKIRVVDSGGVKCACSRRKNGNCLCKLPNNKRKECKTREGEGEDAVDVCRREKYIRILVLPEYVKQAQKLGFE